MSAREVENAPRPQVPVVRRPLFPVHRDERILVTGGARGIGAATVEMLVGEGARVAVADVRFDEADRLAARFGDRAMAFAMDAGAVAGLPERVEECVDWLGGLDGIVSNAGIVSIRPALEHSPEDWRNQFDVNVHGAFEVVRSGVEHLRAAGGGRVVFVSSESGKRGHTDMVAYNATKAAVINITRVLAEELAPLNVNVNCVCPGSVATQMLRDVADHYEAQGAGPSALLFEGMTAPQLGRHVEPDEVASVISFLLSPAAQAIRGQSLTVDGGECPY